jgi:hypothetical protein
MPRSQSGSSGYCRSRCITHVESTPLGATVELRKHRGPHHGAALMKRTTKYVGLDVHHASTVASVRDPQGGA